MTTLKDLDDGVKVNYEKFEKIQRIKKIKKANENGKYDSQDRIILSKDDEWRSAEEIKEYHLKLYNGDEQWRK